jgi:hypothetical protein
MGWEELLWNGLEAGGLIEERFLSAQADAFARKRRDEKASACSARNDSLSWVAGKKKRPGGEPGLLSLVPNWEVVPKRELVVAATVTAASTV